MERALERDAMGQRRGVVVGLGSQRGLLCVRGHITSPLGPGSHWPDGAGCGPVWLASSERTPGVW